MLLPLDGMYRLIARRVELRRLTKRQLVLATAHFANGRWTFDGRDRGSALGCIPQYSAAKEPSSCGYEHQGVLAGFSVELQTL